MVRFIAFDFVSELSPLGLKLIVPFRIEARPRWRDACAPCNPRLDRLGGNRRTEKLGGFRDFLQVVHDPEFRRPRAAEAQRIGGNQFPLWSGPEGWHRYATTLRLQLFARKT